MPRPRVKIINHLVTRDRRARDQELDYYRELKSRGGIELVEGKLMDEGKWAVYGPGGWQQFTSRAKAEAEYNWLVKEYGG